MIPNILFNTNAPKIHEAKSLSVRPPFMPTPSTIAIGADAAKRNAITALLMCKNDIALIIVFKLGSGF